MIKHTYENYPYQLSMSWGDNIMHDVLRLPSLHSCFKRRFHKIGERRNMYQKNLLLQTDFCVQN